MYQIKKDNAVDEHLTATSAGGTVSLCPQSRINFCITAHVVTMSLPDQSSGKAVTGPCHDTLSDHNQLSCGSGPARSHVHAMLDQH